MMNQCKIAVSMLDPEDRHITFIRNAGNHKCMLCV
jgi:hypothetical protein